VIATGAGSGYAPFAPGTAGTVVGIPVYLILSHLSWIPYLISVVIFTSLACFISQEAEKIFNQKDSPRIVIDEIAGFQWTMFLVSPTVLHILIGFILFRIFDILKIFPAGYVQDGLPGGYGIVFDDVVAGMYGNIALLLLIKFWGV
jgi:phosphatidylglycerophosphatase A